MAGAKKLPDVSIQVIKETTAQTAEINKVEFGEIIFAVQSGKVQHMKIQKTIKSNSPHGGE